MMDIFRCIRQPCQEYIYILFLIFQGRNSNYQYLPHNSAYRLQTNSPSWAWNLKIQNFKRE